MHVVQGMGLLSIQSVLFTDFYPAFIGSYPCSTLPKIRYWNFRLSKKDKTSKGSMIMEKVTCSGIKQN
jgi:hypothetical protein